MTNVKNNYVNKHFIVCDTNKNYKYYKHSENGASKPKLKQYVHNIPRHLHQVCIDNTIVRCYFYSNGLYQNIIVLGTCVP